VVAAAEIYNMYCLIPGGSEPDSSEKTPGKAAVQQSAAGRITEAPQLGKGNGIHDAPHFTLRTAQVVYMNPVPAE